MPSSPARNPSRLRKTGCRPSWSSLSSHSFVTVNSASEGVWRFVTSFACSRAGANAVFELLALHKPMLLLPLSGASTRGDQELNAKYFKAKGFAKVLFADEVSPESLTRELLALYRERDSYIETMRTAHGVDGTEAILNLIREAANA